MHAKPYQLLTKVPQTDQRQVEKPVVAIGSQYHPTEHDRH